MTTTTMMPNNKFYVCKRCCMKKLLLHNWTTIFNLEKFNFPNKSFYLWLDGCFCLMLLFLFFFSLRFSFFFLFCHCFHSMVHSGVGIFLGRRIFHYVKTRNIRGETGQVAFDDNGDRMFAEYEVINVRERQRKKMVGKLLYDEVSHYFTDNLFIVNAQKICCYCCCCFRSHSSLDWER